MRRFLGLVLAMATLFPGAATGQLQGHPIDARPDLAPILEVTGFRGTVLVYDLQQDRLLSTHPAFADSSRIPASTFKIPNGLIGLETGFLTDERSVMRWDSVMRSRLELNRDLDLATAFRLSALPHFQALARSVGPTTMAEYIDRFGYGNRDLSGGIDRFWVSGGLRISPREQIEFLLDLFRGDLPLAPRAMAVMRQIMERERGDGFVLRAKTGWARPPDGPEIGWWVGWVEKGGGVYFFASMIEGVDPGASFGPARTGVARKVLGRLGILPGGADREGHAAGSDQYRVWSAYLRETFPKYGPLVVMAGLRHDPRLDPGRANEAPKEAFEALVDYNQRLEDSEVVVNPVMFDGEVVVLTKGDREDLGETRGPDSFYRELFKAFPDTPGMIQLSPVGFSQDSSAAVFFPVVYRGGLRCSGSAHLMHKVRGRWQIKEKRFTGIQLIC